MSKGSREADGNCSSGTGVEAEISVFPWKNKVHLHAQALEVLDIYVGIPRERKNTRRHSWPRMLLMSEFLCKNRRIRP
jgi:hypothetical protein